MNYLFLARNVGSNPTSYDPLEKESLFNNNNIIKTMVNKRIMYNLPSRRV